ncbi:outer membrane beta-barrel protein [Marinomonas posidonica]|uniref:Outer membrane protein beta-barrel domain-containing protein n=1 Tax=Marinomonas posidonica (strain CECT 7376 / NCIMB 14433 / IVIA-Po-181) TaxID=491952 RepID=F6CVA3_MARPP|nr:outer membrane beta-barrel protein [Marinomonas posidonica]AEF54213.1 hypothetical protein Mar181_1166 [Marinomonas posidonica IVIA-Po-181]
MRKIFLAFFAYLASTSLMAESKFQAGIGYSMFESTDSYSSGDYKDSIDAPLLAVRYAFSKRFAIEGEYRFSREDSCTKPDGSACNFGEQSIDVSGIDLNLLLGNHLTDEDSIYFYSGVGYFFDRWSYSGNGIDDTISGLQIPFGIGYNFKELSIEGKYIYRPYSNYRDSSFDINLSTTDTYYGNDLFINMFSLKIMYAL